MNVVSTSADRNASAAEREWVCRVAEAQVESFRAELLDTYRWTMFSGRVFVDGSRFRVHVAGHALLRGIASRFERRLRSRLASRWSVVIDLSTTGERASRRWLTQPITRVWREWPGAGSPRSLSTELFRGDGPVLALAGTPSGTLIRALDGTVGWVADALSNRPTTRERWGRSRGCRAWSEVARAYLGVSYKAGGTTPDGFDCSGLTQRIYREVAGTIIPRHSGDQFVDGGQNRMLREGQLAFIGRPDGLLHVGIVIRNPHSQWSVVHASSTQATVVEDPLERYLARCE
jgi:cell wall-associated NlpC family hydrolase